MGTRGFVGFVVDGVEKIFVHGSDSNPSEAGVNVLEWMTRNQDDIVLPVRGGLPDRVRALRLIDDWRDPSPADLAPVRRALMDAGWTEVGKYPADELLVYASWDLDTLLGGGLLLNGADAPMDSLYAEWGYLIDLDAGRFEVYRGFQPAPHTAGRFAHRSPVRDDYYPVALVASWPLTDLPDQASFLNLPGAY